jgi:hypothetical protein
MLSDTQRIRTSICIHHCTDAKRHAENSDQEMHTLLWSYTLKANASKTSAPTILNSHVMLIQFKQILVCTGYAYKLAIVSRIRL